MSLKPTQFNKQGTEKEQMASYKKKMADIKSRGKPLGGAPPVQIPPLNADPVEGPDGRPLTMEQQAGVLRDPRSPLSPHYNPSLADVDAAVKHEQSELMDPHKLRTARQGETMSKQPGPFGGTLPPEAQQDPNFRPGVGSMYASNQPGLRNSPRAKPGAPQLSQETVEGLEALKRFNEDAQQSQEKQAEDAVKEHIEKDPNDSFIEELGLDTSFIDAIKEERGKLDRQDIREAVEARCKPLSIAQMIEEGELRQFVHRPGPVRGHLQDRQWRRGPRHEAGTLQGAQRLGDLSLRQAQHDAARGRDLRAQWEAVPRSLERAQEIRSKAIPGEV